ncbi:hypothetical protein [Pararhodobacter aggregans]|uniref:DUF423 domain-containing protein n=1 Tax=Pararhodobacter aggregans TaxID=404875 RepID=A0A2T7URQ2_9RHOB|nr:hypothetical protein [Pararhodobacter aggregans]PTX00448.1 hypothetical protein C8N33_110159 [Pararhodobacter aggregans]PVE47423.1 hypothetical protein DDE23_11300 [Pararhodobacter aggregans]
MPARPSPRLLTAAALLIATAGIHLALGGPGVYAALRAATDNPGLHLYLALLWHFVTAFFLLGALATGWAAFAPAARRQTTACVAALLLAMGALFGGFGLAVLGEVWTAPQWILTLVIGALLLWPPRAGSPA